MSPAASPAPVHAEHSPTGTGRGLLRVAPDPDRRPCGARAAAPAATTAATAAPLEDTDRTRGAGAAPPPLRLRVLPQALPQAWSPATATGTVTTAPDRQQTLVLHGLPCAVPEPDADDPAPSDVADLPCPEQLARRLVQAAVDVVRGHRPATQVLRWTTPEVYSQLRQRARLEQAAGRAGGRRPVVRSLRTSRSGERGVEVSAVVLDGNRARAVAARLDGEDSRWRLTALIIG